MSTFHEDETRRSPNVELDVHLDVRLFFTCPRLTRTPGAGHVERVGDLAKWSEDHGLSGILIDSAGGGVDPWMLTETVIERTTALKPFVVVRPVFTSPYALATTLAVLARRHGRQIGLCWVTDGCRNGLDHGLSHETQYERLVEYATLVRELTDGRRVTQVGRYVGSGAGRLDAELSTSLRPEYLVSGSCAWGVSAARALDARPLTCAPPPEQEIARPRLTGEGGLKVGLVARPERESAWRSALKKFPPARASALTRTVTPKVSDSHWHLKLCRLAKERASSGDVYWIGPRGDHGTGYPYLVGSHDDVASALATYIRRGFDTFVLDEPESRSELEDATLAFALATGRVAVA